MGILSNAVGAVIVAVFLVLLIPTVVSDDDLRSAALAAPTSARASCWR